MEYNGFRKRDLTFEKVYLRKHWSEALTENKGEKYEE